MAQHLFLCKTAKWLSRVELISADRTGFWEHNGNRMRGHLWREQSYS